MCQRASLLATTMLVGLSIAACLTGDDAGIAPPRSLSEPSQAVPSRPATESARSDLSDARGRSGLPAHDPRPSPAVVSDDLVDVMIGDFACLGDHLPAEPNGGFRWVTGRTVHFGTEVAAPGTTVRALAADGTELAEVVSDDGGWFELEVPDTDSLTLDALTVSRPGFVPVVYRSTHPSLSFSTSVELGAVKPTDIALVEAAAAITVDDGLGSIIVRLHDCTGANSVAGARIAIEGVDSGICYATSRLGLSCEIDRTTSSAHVYVFNLEPGTYTLAAWGFVAPGPDGAAMINRAVVEVMAGGLVVVDVHPE